MDWPSVETALPYLGQLSFGALAGFAAGYALKKVGKIVAVLVGLLFIALQILAYYGFIQIDWLAVQERFDPVLESGNLSRLWQNLLGLLTYNLTFAAAFVPGLLLGLRQG